jgi:Tfp pilus assembly protein PilO
MNLRPRDRMALGAVLLLALVAGFYLLILQPKTNKVQSLNAAIATQQSTLSQAKGELTAGQAAVSALKADAAEWASVNVAVPTAANVPALLRILEHTATAQGVSMQSITLSPASTAPTNPMAPATPSTGSSAASTMPITLSFTGTYLAIDHVLRQLDRFVVVSGGKVHASGPLINVNSVSLSGTPNKLSGQFSATIYELPTASATAGNTTTGVTQ